MPEKEKMIAGELYDPSDEELTNLRIKARKLVRLYNNTNEDEPEKRQELLHELLPNTTEIPDRFKVNVSSTRINIASRFSIT